MNKEEFADCIPVDIGTSNFVRREIEIATPERFLKSMKNVCILNASKMSVVHTAVMHKILPAYVTYPIYKIAMNKMKRIITIIN